VWSGVSWDRKNVVDDDVGGVKREKKLKQKKHSNKVVK
jgi:hypothetical protein